MDHQKTLFQIQVPRSPPKNARKDSKGRTWALAKEFESWTQWEDVSDRTWYVWFRNSKKRQVQCPIDGEIIFNNMKVVQIWHVGDVRRAVIELIRI